MACPNRKVATLEELQPPEVLQLWWLALLAQALLREVIKAQGFNLGVNIGSVAGAGIAHHLHIHIVPRWPGDANFMPVIAQTRILPQALEPLYDRLREALPTVLTQLPPHSQ
jgi:ATP adenylyltransferase